MILDWNICDIKRQSVLIVDAGPHLFGVSLVLLCWIVRIHGPDLPESLRLLARETRVSDPISDSGFSSATITLGGTLHVNITLGGTLHVTSFWGYTAYEQLATYTKLYQNCAHSPLLETNLCSLQCA